MLLRLPMNMNAYVGSILVCSASIKSGYNYALRIMGHPSRRVAILICDGPLKTPAPVIFSFLSPSNGVNEPSV